jgi:hypothetical protein
MHPFVIKLRTPKEKLQWLPLAAVLKFRTKQEIPDFIIFFQEHLEVSILTELINFPYFHKYFVCFVARENKTRTLLNNLLSPVTD